MAWEPVAEANTTELVKENPIRYAGYYWDRKTQFYYLQACYYDPRPARFISEDSYEGELANPLSLNQYTYAHNNPLNFVDPSGMAPVLIGYVYIIEGPYKGNTETYIGSTAQDIKKRMGNHRWKQIVRHPDTTVKAIEVKAELDIEGSGRGTYFSARKEALSAAEQEVLEKYKKNRALLNKIAAAEAKNIKIWKTRHSVKLDINSSKLALKGGNRVNSALGIFDIYNQSLDIIKSQYEYAPYYMQDEGGVFTIGYSKNGWFSKTKYFKTYQSGPSGGKKVDLNKEEFNFWKAEWEALWGYLNGWGNFVPGLLNPVLSEAETII